MAHLIQRENVDRVRVYDVTTKKTHNFFAVSRKGAATHPLLVHNSHRLSKQALDGLLKPMEDSVRGSQNKLLVCIFCTTEPEKMRTTILSRCAPAFTIRVVPPEKIADRLAYVCDQEGIEYERDALVTIAAVKESHIRDALKAIESIALLGPVTHENVSRYLLLHANETIAKILAYLGSDLSKAMQEATALAQIMSPTTCYERIMDTAMLAFKTHIGAAKPPVYWRGGFIEQLGQHHGEYLVVFANRLASRPNKPTPTMLALDLATLHQIRRGVSPSPQPAFSPVLGTEVPTNGTSTTPMETSVSDTGKVERTSLEANTSFVEEVHTTSHETSTGRYIDPRGVKKRRGAGVRVQSKTHQPLEIDAFSNALDRRLCELKEDGGLRRPPGRGELGGFGTNSTGGDSG